MWERIWKKKIVAVLALIVDAVTAKTVEVAVTVIAFAIVQEIITTEFMVTLAIIPALAVVNVAIIVFDAVKKIAKNADRAVAMVVMFAAKL